MCVRVGNLGKNGEPGLSDSLLVAFAMYGRILARRSRRDDVREPFGIRYGDKRARPSLVTRATDAGTRG